VLDSCAAATTKASDRVEGSSLDQENHITDREPTTAFVPKILLTHLGLRAHVLNATIASEIRPVAENLPVPPSIDLNGQFSSPPRVQVRLLNSGGDSKLSSTTTATGSNVKAVVHPPSPSLLQSTEASRGWQRLKAANTNSPKLGTDNKKRGPTVFQPFKLSTSNSTKSTTKPSKSVSHQSSTMNPQQERALIKLRELLL
jgi:hypothetical protein